MLKVHIIDYAFCIVYTLYLLLGLEPLTLYLFFRKGAEHP
jgi:hypothetical protein